MRALIDRAMARMKLMVEYVTDVKVDEDGNATCSGVDDHPLAPTVGYHFGFYSRPNDGARGLVLKADGQGNTSFLIAWRDKQYELSLEKGECGMKNAFDAQILLDKNGIVNLNGSDHPLPKWDDFLTDFKTFITNLNTDLTAGSAGGVTTTSTAAFQPQLSAPGAYVSTKVKNG